MGIYVQQQHFQEEIEFTGIWAAPVKILVNILINEMLATLHFTECVFAATTSAIIVARLPSYLAPANTETNGVRDLLRVTDNGVLSVGGYRLFSLPSGEVQVQVGTALNSTIPFSGTGQSGFSRFDMTYILEQTR
jgi:hypothetical protein